MKHLFLLALTVAALNGIAQKKDYVVTIHTRYGDMIALLYDETPKHKANFIKLAKEHYYDSLLFHRVIKDFMIQGGDPNSKKANPGTQLGAGGPGYTIDAEFNSTFYHEKGALSAARMNDQSNPTKASSGSQFYIVHGSKILADELKIDRNKLNTSMMTFLNNPAHASLRDTLNQLYSSGNHEQFQQKITELIPRIEKETGTVINKNISTDKLNAYTTIGGAPHLDGEYTVFGKVIQGLDVLDKIASEQVDRNDRPKEDVAMIITVKEISRKKIEKLYEYTYPEKKN